MKDSYEYNYKIEPKSHVDTVSQVDIFAKVNMKCETDIEDSKTDYSVQVVLNYSSGKLY